MEFGRTVGVLICLLAIMDAVLRLQACDQTSPVIVVNIFLINRFLFSVFIFWPHACTIFFCSSRAHFDSKKDCTSRHKHISNILNLFSYDIFL
jgi:hypothetical protein